MERVDGKAAGDHGFITCQRIGLADGARADAIPNAAGGEDGHGAAKPDGVIHRYISNQKILLRQAQRAFKNYESRARTAIWGR
jgi:hypothetical protein